MSIKAIIERVRDRFSGRGQECATVALLAATIAAVPPAFYAATRGPVRVLRTP